jgi:hypothetical protein
MEHLLTATLALNPTPSTQPQKQAATVTDKQPDESQFDQRLIQEKWQLTVPFLMLGVC